METRIFEELAKNQRWIELAIEIGEWNFLNNWEVCETVLEQYNFLDGMIEEEGYDYAMDYATDRLIHAFDILRKMNQIIRTYEPAIGNYKYLEGEE
tara:strand:- start:229 stop:516 length:288 start_codon:yes stop_codon:yes gene_type:complete